MTLQGPHTLKSSNIVSDNKSAFTSLSGINDEWHKIKLVISTCIIYEHMKTTINMPVDSCSHGRRHD